MTARAWASAIVLACGCASAPSRDVPTAPEHASIFAPAVVVPDAAVEPGPRRGSTARPRRPVDPCEAPHRSRWHALLCSASAYDDDCVGIACARTDSRAALECAIDGGATVEDFTALSRAANPVTRVYAREALLRLDAMTPSLILEGLTDAAIVERRGGCIVDSVAAAEPALVALLQREGPEVDAWLVALLESEIGRRMLREPLADASAPSLRAVLHLATQPGRSAALRALVGEIADARARSLPAGWSEWAPQDELTAAPAAVLLRQWTRDMGCAWPPRALDPALERAAEQAQTERLLELERALAAEAALDAR